jgi:hypothetical protein
MSDVGEEDCRSVHTSRLSRNNVLVLCGELALSVSAVRCAAMSARMFVVMSAVMLATMSAKMFVVMLTATCAAMSAKMFVVMCAGRYL